MVDQVRLGPYINIAQLKSLEEKLQRVTKVIKMCLNNNSLAFVSLFMKVSSTHMIRNR